MIYYTRHLGGRNQRLTQIYICIIEQLHVNLIVFEVIDGVKTFIIAIISFTFMYSKKKNFRQVVDPSFKTSHIGRCDEVTPLSSHLGNYVTHNFFLLITCPF